MRVLPHQRTVPVGLHQELPGGVRRHPLEDAPPKRRVARIGLWSVVKVSVFFYVVVGIALVTAGVALSAASGFIGLTPHLQHLASSLFSVKSLPLGPARVAAVVAAASAALAIAGTVVNVLVALIYNLIADLVGGVGVTR